MDTQPEKQDLKLQDLEVVNLLVKERRRLDEEIANIHKVYSGAELVALMPLADEARALHLTYTSAIEFILGLPLEDHSKGEDGEPNVWGAQPSRLQGYVILLIEKDLCEWSHFINIMEPMRRRFYLSDPPAEMARMEGDKLVALLHWRNELQVEARRYIQDKVREATKAE